MNISRIILSLTSIIFLCGCQTINGNKSQSSTEAKEALTSIAGAMSGKQLSEKDIEALSKRVQNDPETKSAVETLTNSLSGKERKIYYCPIDGVRYSQAVAICPVHHIPLKAVDE